MSLVRVLTRPHVGMGSYPNEPCYDPDRASWLPYWIPNPNETACNAAVAKDAATCLLFPWTQTCAAGAAKVGGAVLEAAGSALETAGGTIKPNAPPNAPSTPKPVCVGFKTFNPESGDCEFDPSTPSFIILAIGSVAVIGLVLAFVKK